MTAASESPSSPKKPQHHHRGHHEAPPEEEQLALAKEMRAALDADLVDQQLRTGGEEGVTQAQLLRCVCVSCLAPFA